jgi:hypothetical protein
MKTTIEIADPLLREAKATARSEKRTLRSLLEEALRRHLEERRRGRKRKPFTLRDASVDGDGPSPEFADGSWDSLRDAIYEGRGT